MVIVQRCVDDSVPVHSLLGLLLPCDEAPLLAAHVVTQDPLLNRDICYQRQAFLCLGHCYLSHV